MRLRAILGAATLMTFAAIGFSPSLSSDDYCGADTFQQQWWPPGVHCQYAPDSERGTGPVEPDTANVGAFFAILAAGLGLVLGRRSQLALGSALVFGIAGFVATLVGGHPLIFFGCFFGALAAYWVTRSIAATVVPLAALIIAFTVQFIVDVPLAWAGALLVLMLLPQRAQQLRPAMGRPQSLSNS